MPSSRCNDAACPAIRTGDTVDKCFIANRARSCPFQPCFFQTLRSDDNLRCRAKLTPLFTTRPDRSTPARFLAIHAIAPKSTSPLRCPSSAPQAASSPLSVIHVSDHCVTSAIDAPLPRCATPHPEFFHRDRVFIPRAAKHSDATYRESRSDAHPCWKNTPTAIRRLNRCFRASVRWKLASNTATRRIGREKVPRRVNAA